MKPVPFPPHTKGYFYFHQNMTLEAFVEEETGEEMVTVRPTHIAGGQLRFRLVDPIPAVPALPGDYASSDLMMDNGRSREWCIPVLVMQRRSEYQALYESILPEPQRNLIEAFLERSRQNAKFHDESYNKGSRFLDSILEPFPMDFTKNTVYLSLLDPECVTKISLRHVMSIQPRKRPPPVDALQPHSVYSGKAWVRFELVNVTRKNNVPATRLAIRVLQWIEPPDPSDKQLVQQEGELLKKCDAKTLEEKIWTKPNFTDFLPPASVRMLLETYPTSETIGLGRLHRGKRQTVEE